MRIFGSIIPSQPLLMRAGQSKTPECPDQCEQQGASLRRTMML